MIGGLFEKNLKILSKRQFENGSRKDIIFNCCLFVYSTQSLTPTQPQDLNKILLQQETDIDSY